MASPALDEAVSFDWLSISAIQTATAFRCGFHVQQLIIGRLPKTGHARNAEMSLRMLIEMS